MSKRSYTPKTPESRETRLVGLALDVAEQKLRDGTASSQLITTILRQDTAKARLEVEKLQQENELLKAKTESLRSAQHTEEMYQEAIKAFARYQGNSGDEDEDYEDDYDDEY